MRYGADTARRARLSLSDATHRRDRQRGRRGACGAVCPRRRAGDKGHTGGGRESGWLLADLVRRLATLDLDPPLPNPEWVRWDATPELDATAAVPAWIDDAIRRVQAKLAGCDLPPVLGHADWEAQNIRWRNGEAHVVHDWDSLAWLPEAAIAGSAAGIFASHGKTTLAPLEGSEAFLHAYEGERGARFSPYETQIAWAASIWEALHDARDELSYDRPKLNYERLKAERVERLTRAHA